MMKSQESLHGRSGEALRKRQRAKNWALFAALAGFAVLIYLIAIVRMGGG